MGLLSISTCRTTTRNVLKQTSKAFDRKLLTLIIIECVDADLERWVENAKYFEKMATVRLRTSTYDTFRHTVIVTYATVTSTGTKGSGTYVPLHVVS